MLLKNDFSWNWAIRIGELVSTFRCWQFSPSSFFAQKNTTNKLIFLCLIFTDMNSSQKEINVPFLSKKESHFDRCTHRGFLLLHVLLCLLKVCVFMIPGVIILKMRKSYIFLVLGSDFRPSWCLVMLWNAIKKCIFCNLQNLLKIL